MFGIYNLVCFPMKAQAYHIPHYLVGAEYSREIKAAFVRRGETLSAWCVANGVSRQYVYQVLTGKRAGSAADNLPAKINQHLMETNHV
jgi:gp16 family phage-associated protein